MAERKEVNTLDVGSLPSNSKTAKAKPKEKNIEKVVKARVKTKKRSSIQKAADSIVNTDDMENVRTYVIWDVVIPAIKNAIFNGFQGALEILLFGSSKNSQREDSRNHIRYDKPSYATSRRNDEQRRHNSSPPHDYRDVIFESRNDALDVLDNMYELTRDYGEVSVADFYDLVGISGNFTDNKYGWVNLDDADIAMARGGGYLLDLPRPVRLD